MKTDHEKDSFFYKWIIRHVLLPWRLLTGEKSVDSRYRVAKGFYSLRLIIRGWISDAFMIFIGIISAGFGLKGFLLPNGFLDGGATGISLLTAELTHLPLSVLLIGVNFPFLMLGFRVVGREFTIKAILAILGLALCVAVVPYPEITNDKLLIAVFGGFFLGAGIGMSVRGGAVIDGTEILAIYISRRSPLSIGDVILVVNIIIFMVAAYFLTIETALYAMLTYLAASKTVDFILEGIEEYTGVTVISYKAEDIRQMITNELQQGVTVYKGEGGFGKSGHRRENVKIIYTVVTRLEVNKVRSAIQRVDPQAFIVMNSLKDTIGGMTKKRRHKEH